MTAFEKGDTIFADYASIDPSYKTMLAQFRKKEPVHAYLLTGAAGIGKLTYARFLVSALYCEAKEQDRPCGVCSACKRLLSGSNPDVTELVSDGASLKVEDVRRVLNAISQFSFGSGYRVVLIEPVEKLTPEAQNCLLKSLEEPPGQVVFLMLSHDPSSVLPTIISRCMRVKMRFWQDELIQKVLKARGCTDDEAVKAAALAGGNIGQAILYAQSAEQSDALNEFAMSALGVKSDADAVRLSTRLKEDRGGASAYLDAIEQAMSTAIRVNMGQLPQSVLAGYPSKWRRMAAQGELNPMLKLISAVTRAKRERAGQVNWQSNIDLLLLTILEETKTWQ